MGATEFYSVGSWLEKAGSGSTPGSPKHDLSWHSLLRMVGRGSRPHCPQNPCSSGVQPMDRKSTRNAVLMHLVLIPNAGAPRCSWTKGEKRLRDRGWAWGGEGLHQREQKRGKCFRGPANPPQPAGCHQHPALTPGMLWMQEFPFHPYKVTG